MGWAPSRRFIPGGYAENPVLNNGCNGACGAGVACQGACGKFIPGGYAESPVLNNGLNNGLRDRFVPGGYAENPVLNNALTRSLNEGFSLAVVGSSGVVQEGDPVPPDVAMQFNLADVREPSRLVNFSIWRPDGSNYLSAQAPWDLPYAFQAPHEEGDYRVQVNDGPTSYSGTLSVRVNAPPPPPPPRFEDCPSRWNPDLQACCPDGMTAVYDPGVNAYVCQPPDAIALFVEGDPVAVRTQHGQLLPGIVYRVISVNPVLGSVHPDRTYNVGLDDTDVGTEELPASELSFAPAAWVCNSNATFDPQPYLEDPPGAPWVEIDTKAMPQGSCYYGPCARIRAEVTPHSLGVGIFEHWLVSQARGKVLDVCRSQGAVPLFLAVYRDDASGKYLMDLTIAKPPGTGVQASGFLLAAAIFAAILIALAVGFQVTGVTDLARITAHGLFGNPATVTDATPGILASQECPDPSVCTIFTPDGTRRVGIVQPGDKKVTPPTKSGLGQISDIVKYLGWGALAVGGIYLAINLTSSKKQASEPKRRQATN